MEKIRDIAKHYHVSKIYNMDESGLFYRMGLQRMYLSASEQHDAFRHTEFGKHKERVAIVLPYNADRSHVHSLRYIGSANNLRCFQNGRFDSQKIVIGSKRMARWILRDSIIGLSGGSLRFNLVRIVHSYLS